MSGAGPAGQAGAGGLHGAGLRIRSSHGARTRAAARRGACATRGGAVRAAIEHARGRTGRRAARVFARGVAADPRGGRAVAGAGETRAERGVAVRA